jgi:hypothetical protein
MKRALVYLALALPSFATDPWKMPHSAWTEEDARRILQSSPWAKAIPGSGANIRWESARPVQLAIEKMMGKAPALSCSGCYAVAIVGGTNLELTTTSVATLKANGRPRISSIGSKMIGDAAVFIFPRHEELGQPIVFRLPVGVKLGNTIDFETEIGGRIVKQRFLPGRMTYDGRVEL